MSHPEERFGRILDEILGRFDLSHDFGRKAAHEAAIDYARDHLVDDPQCDDFLRAAASRLGFAPVSFAQLENRVRVGRDAWVDVWISDEDDEIALTASKQGIEYLIDLLIQLRDSDDYEQHVHLDRGIAPMTGSSANLVLFKEEPSWFTGEGAAAETPQYPEREVDPQKIYAIQFIHYPPEDLPITGQKLYRVERVRPSSVEAASVKDFPDGAPERYFEFTFRADNGEPFRYVFHLDDPGVNFFTHRDIISLAMKPV